MPFKICEDFPRSLTQGMSTNDGKVSTVLAIHEKFGESTCESNLFTSKKSKDSIAGHVNTHVTEHASLLGDHHEFLQGRNRRLNVLDILDELSVSLI